MSQWSATEMPRWRNTLIGGLAQGSQRDPENYHPGWASALTTAEMYWVTKDMTMVAYDSSERLEAFTPREILPAPSGLLIWNGELPMPPMHESTRQTWAGVHMPTVGIMWHTHNDVVRFFALVRMSDAKSAFASLMGAGFEADWFNALLPLSHWELELAAQYDAGGADDITALVATTMELMQQPTVATPRRVNGAAGGGKVFQRLDRKVTIIDLRAMKSVSEETEPGTGRVYTHRWIVPSFPRLQRYGPGLSKVKRIWVAPHIKGPEGAPLIQRDRVHVWRR